MAPERRSLPGSYVEFVPSSDTAPSLASDSLMRTNMLPTAQELAAPTTTAASSDHADDAPPAEERLVRDAHRQQETLGHHAAEPSSSTFSCRVGRAIAANVGTAARLHGPPSRIGSARRAALNGRAAQAFDYIAALDGAAGSGAS